MTFPAFHSSFCLAVAAAIVATLASSYFASAVDLTTYTCEGLASLPTDDLTEDSRLIIRGSVYTCDDVGTAREILGMLSIS